MTAESIYLDWVNNYLTREAMASHYGWEESKLREIIKIGRMLNHARH